MWYSVSLSATAKLNVGKETNRRWDYAANDNCSLYFMFCSIFRDKSSVILRKLPLNQISPIQTVLIPALAAIHVENPPSSTELNYSTSRYFAHSINLLNKPTRFASVWDPMNPSAANPEWISSTELFWGLTKDVWISDLVGCILRHIIMIQSTGQISW